MMNFEHLDCSPIHFRLFSPIIGLLKKKRVMDGPTDGQTDGQTDLHIAMHRDARTLLKILKAMEKFGKIDSRYSLVISLRRCNGFRKKFLELTHEKPSDA